MITTTLGQLVDAEPALHRLAAQKLPAVSAYRLAKICTAVAEDTKIFTERRLELIKEVGVSRQATAAEQARGETTMLEVAPPHMRGFLAQLSEMASVSVTLPMEPLTITLKTLETIEISAADLLAMETLVVIDEGTS